MLFSHWPTENLLISYWLKNSRFSKLKVLETLGFGNSRFWKLQVFKKLQVFQKLKVFQNFRLKCNKTKVESDQLGRLLKSTIFVVQRAAAPKNGVEFRQKSIGAIRCSVATSYDDVRCCAMSVPFHQSEVRGGWVYNPILVIIFTKPINYSR